MVALAQDVQSINNHTQQKPVSPMHGRKEDILILIVAWHPVLLKRSHFPNPKPQCTLLMGTRKTASLKHCRIVYFHRYKVINQSITNSRKNDWKKFLTVILSLIIFIQSAEKLNFLKMSRGQPAFQQNGTKFPHLIITRVCWSNLVMSYDSMFRNVKLSADACCFRKRRQHFNYFRNLRIPGPEPSIFFGNMMELYRKVS